MKNFFFKTYTNLKNNKELEYEKMLSKILKKEKEKKNFLITKGTFPLKKKHICLKTGNKRSVDSIFHISRQDIRADLKIGNLNGLKKIS